MWWRKIKVLSPADGYNLWAKSYHAEANPIKKLSDDFIASSMGELRNYTVLDAGCGTGKLCSVALDQGADTVDGIDLSNEMIAQARQNCPQANFACGDLTTSDIESSRYDLAICGLVLGHIPLLEPALLKLTRSVKPGGKIILTDFHPYQSLNQAKRTFKSTFGRVYEVSHTAHMFTDYFRILKSEGFRITDFREPLYNALPVIFGITATKS